MVKKRKVRTALNFDSDEEIPLKGLIAPLKEKNRSDFKSRKKPEPLKHPVKEKKRAKVSKEPNSVATKTKQRSKRKVSQVHILST